MTHGRHKKNKRSRRDEDRCRGNGHDRKGVAQLSAQLCSHWLAGSALRLCHSIGSFSMACTRNFVRRQASEGRIRVLPEGIRFKPVNDIASVTTVIVDFRNPSYGDGSTSTT